MLTLMLLRHAKAEPGSARLADQDRPLSGRGQSDAPRMGAWISEHDLVPDLVVCSTARRTRETLTLVTPAFGRDVPASFDPAVYEATTARLLTVLRRTPAAPRRLMLIGHNPGLEDLALDLMGDAEPGVAERLRAKFPTCGLAVLDLPVAAWAQLTPRSARLTQYMAPRFFDVTPGTEGA